MERLQSMELDSAQLSHLHLQSSTLPSRGKAFRGKIPWIVDKARDDTYLVWKKKGCSIFFK